MKHLGYLLAPYYPLIQKSLNIFLEIWVLRMPNKNDLFVIVGSNGFIGKTVCEKLVEKKCDFVSISSKNVFINKRKNKIKSDRRYWPKYAKKYKNIIIIYAAWKTYPRSNYKIEPELYEKKKNQLPLERFFKKELTNLKFKNLVCFFFSSGGECYGELKNRVPFKETFPNKTKSPYGKGKLLGEKIFTDLSKKISKKTIILRLSNPYGEHQFNQSKQGLIAQLIKKCLSESNFIKFNNFNPIRDYFYINDMLVLFLKHQNFPSGENIYNIGSGKGFSLNELIKIIENVFNKKIKYKIKKKSTLGYKGYKSNILNIGKINKIFNFWNSTQIRIGIKLMGKYYLKNYKC